MKELRWSIVRCLQSTFGHVLTPFTAHSTELPKCDESFLLYWAHAQIKRDFQSIFEQARLRHPYHRFDQIAFCVQAKVGKPVDISFYPLVPSPLSFHSYQVGAESTRERHFQKLTLQRNERGDKDAAMVMIRRSDGWSTDINMFVVSLDKSNVSPPGCALLPIDQISEVDRAVQHVMAKAAHLEVNFWNAKLIRKYVDRYIKGL